MHGQTFGKIRANSDAKEQEAYLRRPLSLYSCLLGARNGTKARQQLDRVVRISYPEEPG